MSRFLGGIFGQAVGFSTNLSDVESGVYTLKEASWNRQRNGWVSTFTATGGNTVDTSSMPGYKMHIFTASGSLVVTDVGPGTCDILVVGGGGGGSADGTAGGGGGGLVWRPGMPIPAAGTYPVTIGAGGAHGDHDGDQGDQGTPSTFNDPTGSALLVGLGGGGARHATTGGSTGGSGGGGGYGGGTGLDGIQTTEPTIPADSRTYGFGNPGGDGGNAAPQYTGAGGGGALTAGSDGPGAGPAGAGGHGKDMSPVVGTSYGAPGTAGQPGTAGGGWFAGGGGGNINAPTGSGIGGKGGGGNGTGPGGTPGNTGGSGTTNSGGGGGAGYRSPTVGGGGPGVVIVRYATS